MRTLLKLIRRPIQRPERRKLDQQVQTMSSLQRLSLVGDGKCDLLPVIDLPQAQLLSQAGAVHRLQEPGTEMTMDLDGSGNDLA